MKAIIAGAGPGGLTAALFLHKIGWDVEVYESTPKIEPLGVGINLLPHGTRELMVLGLGDELADTGIQTRALEYRTKYGHLIYSDPRGEYAGFKFPSYSIHRGHLQFLLLDAFKARAGADKVHVNCHFERFEEDDEGVTAYFVDPGSKSPAAEDRGDILIGADGVHSAVRKIFYPNDGPPRYEGLMMWRGATEREPYLDGETMFVAGDHNIKAVVYPMSEPARRNGKSLVNWVAEVRDGNARPLNPNDWNRKGTLDFIENYRDFKFDFIDLPQLFSETETVYEYPMIDRDPVKQWSFGRVTLMGDSAHAMLPIGANGTSQAILDARALADCLEGSNDMVAALKEYEQLRLGPTSKIVESNRNYDSENYLDLVADRIKGPDDKMEDLISQNEIDTITDKYRKIAGFQVKALNEKGLG
jgi:5-methylphenazine-1-carboxylate 1-monooxygenase